MKTIERGIEGYSLPHAICLYCHEEIVEVPDVGWIDPQHDDTYDLCSVSPDADHEPSDAPTGLDPRSGPVH